MVARDVRDIDASHSTLASLGSSRFPVAVRSRQGAELELSSSREPFSSVP